MFSGFLNLFNNDLQVTFWVITISVCSSTVTTTMSGRTIPYCAGRFSVERENEKIDNSPYRQRV